MYQTLKILIREWTHSKAEFTDVNKTTKTSQRHCNAKELVHNRNT